MNLAGKTVLVTGGAIRVGEVLCRAFAAHGASVIIHCRNSYREAQQLLASLPGTGHQTVSCDLEDSALAKEMIRSFAPDILVNNAAGYSRADITQEEETDAMRQYRINFLTPVSMIRTLAEIRKGRETAVINILDCGIRKTDPDSFSYALSKKMLESATRAAALQCGPDMRVNAVAPGNMIPTEDLKHLNMRSTRERLPLKRPPAPEDMAEAAVFLAWNRSITGTVLFVDCGQSLLSNMEN